MSEPQKLPLTAEAIQCLVDVFYDRVQVHPALGPVFGAHVRDWTEHKATLVNFWSSIALKTGTYRGNVMQKHHARGIVFENFGEWLDLWKQTTDELLEPSAAREMQIYAERIGNSLKYGLGLTGTHGGRDLGIPVIR